MAIRTKDRFKKLNANIEYIPNKEDPFVPATITYNEEKLFFLGHVPIEAWDATLIPKGHLQENPKQCAYTDGEGNLYHVFFDLVVGRFYMISIKTKPEK